LYFLSYRIKQVGEEGSVSMYKIDTF
jgi:hypothetical protein